MLFWLTIFCAFQVGFNSMQAFHAPPFLSAIHAGLATMTLLLTAVNAFLLYAESKR